MASGSHFLTRSATRSRSQAAFLPLSRHRGSPRLPSLGNCGVLTQPRPYQPRTISKPRRRILAEADRQGGRARLGLHLLRIQHHIRVHIRYPSFSRSLRKGGNKAAAGSRQLIANFGFTADTIRDIIFTFHGGASWVFLRSGQSRP